ncbi:MAG: hypothetical protein AAGK97_04425 [Bacteroidota bacterium]
MKQIEISSNFETLSASLFESEKSDTVLIIASATGVRQEYYHKFSKYLEIQIAFLFVNKLSNV